MGMFPILLPAAMRSTVEVSAAGGTHIAFPTYETNAALGPLAISDVRYQSKIALRLPSLSDVGNVGREHVPFFAS